MKKKIFEDAIIKRLIDNGYSYIEINNKEELEQNFRIQIENFNKDELNNKKLTNEQFDQLMSKLEEKNDSEEKNDVFTCAQRLRNAIHITDTDQKDPINLRLFDTKKWCSNYFQVTYQVKEALDNHHSFRYDIIILINGLPLVMMELKKPYEPYEKAFEQIKNYKIYGLQSLFRYLQLFIISNYNTTKYFVNNELNYLSEELMFSWGHENNKIIDNLDEFVDSFLNRCHLGKMIARFIVLNKTEKKLIVLKPYQVHAAEKLMKLVEETNNNGYVWHATGSGKTLTSFKLSQILEETLEEKYIFFLVDRKDLDEQTIQEFNKFDADIVEDIGNTKKLIEIIQKGYTSLIITTIQKLNIICQLKDAVLNKLKNKNMKIIFIIDECHRSQAGEMRQKIESFFNKNEKRPQFLGFTGTPILYKENPNQKTTDDLFEKCHHKYLLINAIKDHNVVPWEIVYRKNNDKISSNHELIVEDILEKHHENTCNGKFNALLTVSKIEDLMSYYNLFKDKKHNFKVAAIFHESYDNENVSKKIIKNKNAKYLAEIINDYNKTFGTKVNNQNYYSHLVKKFKKKEIDLLIVVNMFLVGFDSPRTNTLYVDRKLKKHSLIQAFSRVNRLCSSSYKDRGKIFCYQTTKKDVDTAIELFAIETHNQLKEIIVEEKEIHIETKIKLKEKIQQLLQIAPNIKTIEQLDDYEQQKKFLKAFKELQKFIKFIKKHKPKFDWHDFNEQLPPDQFTEFKKKYENIRIKVQINSINSPKTSKYEEKLEKWKKQAELKPGKYLGKEINNIGRLFTNNEIEDQSIDIIFDHHNSETKILKSLRIDDQNNQLKSVFVQNNNVYQNNDFSKVSLSFQDYDRIKINGYWSSKKPPSLNQTKKTKDNQNLEKELFELTNPEIINYHYMKKLLKKLKETAIKEDKKEIIKKTPLSEEYKKMLFKFSINNDNNIYNEECKEWYKFIESQLNQEKKEFCKLFTSEKKFVDFINELIKDYKYYKKINRKKIFKYLEKNSSFFDSYTRDTNKEMWELNGQMIDKIINFIEKFIQKEKEIRKQ